MQAIGSVSALFAGLLHPRAQAPLTRLGHHDFIASKLVLVALALAAAPVFVAVRGVPTPGEAAIFALALAQLPAALLVVRWGRFDLGQDMGVAGLAAIGVASAAIPTLHPCCAGAWLAAAAVEATAAGRGRALVATAGAALTAICILAASHGPADGAASFAAAAAVPALQAAWRSRRLLAATDRAMLDAERHGRLMAAIGGALVADLDPSGLARRVLSGDDAPLPVDREALAGRGLFEHVHVADRPLFLKLVSDAAHGGGRQCAVLRLRCAPGRHLAVEMRVVGDPAGGVVATLRNVADAQRAEAAREEARHLVEEALRSRDEFLANISHELRTPLNAVIGFSEMLASQTLRPAGEEKQREYARIILQSGQHLLSVVSAILDMSKIRSGTFALSPERFDVRQLVEQCRDMMQLKAEAGRVKLLAEVAAGVGALRGDRRACRQILINLLANAVKFTPEGGEVAITADVDGGALRFTVRDTGIGVAAADLGKLGQPFFQVNGSLCRSFEGTGLGLSVVRGLVGLHDGDLAIASDLGRGTTVTVRLPLEGPRTAPLACDTEDAGTTGASPERPSPQDTRPEANVAPLPIRRPATETRMKRRA